MYIGKFYQTASHHGNIHYGHAMTTMVLSTMGTQNLQ